MLRDRVLGVRWLVCLVVAWSAAWMALPRLAEAAPFPPGRDAGPIDLETVRAALETRVARDSLAALGLDAEEATAVVERLTPEERAELVARASELAVGGDVAAAAIVAVAIIVGMIIILVLELMGRRVVSRPPVPSPVAP